MARLTSLGYTRHDFDRMLFCLYDHDGQLLSLVMCYVDDFFVESTEKITTLLSCLASFDGANVHIFLRMKPRPSRARSSNLSRTPRADLFSKSPCRSSSTQLRHISYQEGRLQKGELLTPSKQREFRSIAGFFNGLDLKHDPMCRQQFPFAIMVSGPLPTT